MGERLDAAAGPRVAIIGGGLAGMAVAAGLVEAGFLKAGGKVQIFEAKRRSGGRAGSFLDSESGQEVDYCQHVAMGCCTNLLHLLRWAEIDSQFQRYDTLNFFAPGLPSCNFQPSRRLPAPLHLASAFSRLSILSREERREVKKGIWRLMRLSPAKLGRRAEGARRPMTMGDWLRRNGQSDGVIRKFWNLVLASALGEHVDAVAIMPARKVFVDGFLRCRGASDVLVPQQPLSELFGKQLPDFLCSAGVEMIYQRRIRQCVADGDGRIELRVDNRPAVVADYVVAAVPWFALPRLLSRSNLGAAVAGLDEIGLFPSSPISGVHLWLDRELTELPHAVIADAISQWVFRDPRMNETSSHSEHYFQVVISAAHDVRGRNADQLGAEIVAELNAVFPGEVPATALRSRIVTDPAAVFSITPQVERMRPPTATGAKNLFLAGDWVQTGWPATMESAVISGFQAAREITQVSGMPLAVIQPPQSIAPLSRFLIR